MIAALGTNLTGTCVALAVLRVGRPNHDSSFSNTSDRGITMANRGYDVVVDVDTEVRIAYLLFGTKVVTYN